MMLFSIREPIWKDRSVGLNEAQLDEENQIEITYQDKNGERLYPLKYRITKEEALAHKVMIVKGIRLRIVPIVELPIL